MQGIVQEYGYRYDFDRDPGSVDTIIVIQI